MIVNWKKLSLHLIICQRMVRDSNQFPVSWVAKGFNLIGQLLTDVKTNWNWIGGADC
jgi:hypothetical protein